MKIRELRKEEIEVKIKQVTKKGAIALLYKTARTDMAVLDETFGAMNWTDDYKEIKGNLYCGIGVRKSEDKPFVWKWDCGVESREDREGNEKKGEASDSFKRAGFKWGIGRELYTAPFIFLKVPTEFDGKKYKLVDEYQRFYVGGIDYIDGRISKLLIIDDKHKVVFTHGSKADHLPTPQKREKLQTYVCDQMAGDIYMRAKEKGHNEKAVNQVIQALFGTDNIFDLTTEQGNELIKRLEK